MIGIIDYGLGNIRAFSNIYESLDIPNKIVKAENDFEDVQKIILPGVGAFDYAITSLRESLLLPRLDYEVLECNKPVLGICVGMQMMANNSEEGKLDGLGWIDANVKKFNLDKVDAQKFPLPHMGWNKVTNLIKNDLLKNLNRYIDYCLNIELKSIETSSPKDMLFEVIMARFDILQKNRKSFVMLYDYFKLKPQKLLFLLPSFLESMLITASLAKINIKGINGSITIKGIFVIYIATFFKWVDDTSNSLEKTMTVLDQYLTYVLKIKKYINR